ncbi:hypothetical protein LTR84_011557 [Exophiala bonariae]|uniref:Uncharacterized protein n=1 Tax=Exophiala bonariae TaxID=1690606 RepID=A0AAV9NHD9_9EURO|nr:hypothetical protein LTR84_011557 [Exophiala bonariae]
MKKLVRKLSTRKPDHHQNFAISPGRNAEPSASSPSDTHSNSSLNLSTADIKSPSASGTQPGFIPFGTTLYFQGCPHSTPPTPRPAYIPPVLLTQVSSPSSTSNHSRSRSTSSVAASTTPATHTGTGTTIPQAREATVINQFFTSPRQCFDCSLASARSAQRMAHEAFDAKIRRGRLRIGLACADLASLETQARHTRLLPGDADPDTDTDTEVGIVQQRVSGLRGEIFQAKEIVRDWVAKRDGQVLALWDEVRASWDGAVREVVRDDGSGEGLEKCVFRMRVLGVADADADADGIVDASQSVGDRRPQGVDHDDMEMEMEGGVRIDVVWETVG